MLRIEIPGREPLALYHLALDYNGTIALDGLPLSGVAQRLLALRERLHIHVLTADTHGTAAAQLQGLGFAVHTFPAAGAAQAKAAIVRGLDGQTACMGNGFNDIEMFGAAALSVAVLGQEGMCASLLAHADVLVSGPEDALDLLLKPDRLRATLRT